MTVIPTTKIAASFGLTENDLLRRALLSFLVEEKRQVLQLKLAILAHYGPDSIADLEAKIVQGSVVEHRLGRPDRY